MSKWRRDGKLKAFPPSAAPAYGLIRRGCSPAKLGTARYAMAAWRARPAADKGRPGDQARPRGLKPRAAAAAAARRVPSCWQRSSRAAGDRLLSGAGDQAGGCSGLQGGEPRGGAGWHLHLGPSSQSTPIYPVRLLITRESTPFDDLVLGARRAGGRRGSRSWFRRERPRSGCGGCLGDVARLKVGGRA